MNDNYSTAEMKVSERLSDSRLSAVQRATVDWKKAEREVNRLQARITKAAQKRKWNMVKRLEYLLAHSFYGKVTAAKRAWAGRRRNRQEIERALSDTIKRGKTWSQDVLIRNLNGQIREWAGRCPDKERKKAGARLDYLLYEWLWRWAKRRHPRKGRRWILEKYWHPRGGRKWVFSTDTQMMLRGGRVCRSFDRGVLRQQ